MVPVVLTIGACASTPTPAPVTESPAIHQPQPSPKPPRVKRANPTHSALAIAQDLRGVPYRYGGATPRGFDCSGLVYYTFRKSGLEVPRTSREQYRQSRQVNMNRIRPGDLLFFNISRQKVSHVGIYAGDGRFIHAATSVGKVSDGYLSNPYWQSRLIGAGRF